MIPVPSRFGPRARIATMHARPRLRARTYKSAPATQYPFGPSKSLKFCLIALWISGALLTTYLLLTRPVHALYPWFAGGSLLLGACAAYWGWATTPSGLLRWDGEHWDIEWSNFASKASQPPSIKNILVQFDFQFFLLLRLDLVKGGCHWLWLDRWSDARDWHALRRSVFSPKPSPKLLEPAAASFEVVQARGGHV